MKKQFIKMRDKKLTDILYYGLIIVCLLLIFTFLGERGYVLFKDSQAYLAFTNRSGVMPVYPLFLYLNKLLFGEALYLYFVVAEQTIWAVTCILLFYHFIRKQFSLKRAVACPILIALLVPFTVNLPESMANHEILTEAIAYPLFYLYMIFFLKTIFEKSFRLACITLLFSVFLALIRTQMQLSFVITAAAWFYRAWRKRDGLKAAKKALFILPQIFVCAGIVIAGMGITMLLNLAGQNAVVILNDAGKSAESESAGNTEMKEAAVQAADIDVEPENMTSQYNHVLIDKAMYEMDYEDYLLFEDEEIQKVYLAVFSVSEEEKSRYAYARTGLLKWEDIMNGVAGGTDTAWDGWHRYLEENPESELGYRETVTLISKTLMRRHWGRMLYHIICMIPSGLICTVFFQNRSFYLLCHIVTYLAYLAGIGLVIWAYRKKVIWVKYAENMLGCIVVNGIMVLVMCVMFFPMQRYLIYGFGTFWTAFYIFVIQILRSRFAAKFPAPGRLRSKAGKNK